MKLRKSLRRMSPKRTAQNQLYTKLKAKFLDTNPYCFRCGENVPLKYRDLHHFYGRIGALLCWVPGYRVACRSCHNFIHTSKRNDMVRLGFLAPSRLWNRPSLIIPRERNTPTSL